MKNILFIYLACTITIISCTKNNSKNTATVQSFEQLKASGIRDFVDIVAVPIYSDLSVNAKLLYDALSDINNGKGDLETARNRWKTMRSVWEKSEGFLFGPVETNNYDPYMDTWPTDFRQMDSLLNSNAVFTVEGVRNLILALRGYHPIEYIIYGTDGKKTIEGITDRQKRYMIALAEDLKNTCQALLENWILPPTHYASKFKTAGEPNNFLYPTQQSAYLALVEGMIGICEEVGGTEEGEGKMGAPLKIKDPTKVESPYSSNSIVDFKDNIIGLQAVYLCTYKGKNGVGLSNLVAEKNRALDIKIKTQIYAAIKSFDNITVPFKEAIIKQRVQCEQTIKALNTLAATLDNELKPFVEKFIN